jgi:hypothetical protein
VSAPYSKVRRSTAKAHRRAGATVVLVRVAIPP